MEPAKKSLVWKNLKNTCKKRNDLLEEKRELAQSCGTIIFINSEVG